MSQPERFNGRSLALVMAGAVTMKAYPEVLVLSSDPETHFLTDTLAPFMAVTQVERIPEALALIERGEYDALFCEWTLADGTWRTVLEELRKRRQATPVIVFCHCGGEKEWTEVLQAGAFDFVAPPYGGRQILALMEHARASGHKTRNSYVS